MAVYTNNCETEYNTIVFFSFTTIGTNGFSLRFLKVAPVAKYSMDNNQCNKTFLQEGTFHLSSKGNTSFLIYKILCT